MSTALVSIGDMERMALAFSKSGMFGAKTPDQALALLLLAQAEGQHPAIAMRDFDVIQGRPAKKAEAMLRSFIEGGGKVEWHQMDDTKADATFSHPQGGTARIDWDMARAQKAGLKGKDMYTKYPRQMLANRVISEGCRRVYPASTSGLYVPEEVRQFLKEDKAKPPEKDMGRADIVDEDDDKLRDLETSAGAKAGQEPVAAASKEAPAVGSAPSAPPKTRTVILQELVGPAGLTLPDVLAKAGVPHADKMTNDDFTGACAMLRRRATKRALAQTGEKIADLAQP